MQHSGSSNDSLFSFKVHKATSINACAFFKPRSISQSTKEYKCNFLLLFFSHRLAQFSPMIFRNQMLIVCCSLILAALTSFLIPIAQPKKGFRPGKDFALFFAVSDYDQWPDLQNPIKDAEAIATDLEKYYGFYKPEIVRNPTYDEIVETLNRYANRAYSEDGQLFIFFTGHGLLNNVKEGFFVPKDGRTKDASQQSYLPHNRLAYLINNIPCKHILLGIDACYSGSFMRTIRPKGRPGDRPGESETTKNEAFIQDMLQYKSRLVITSGGEVPTNDNSQFTRQILTALRSRGGESGIIDFYGLVSYLQSARPTPRFGEFGDSEPGGQFLLVYTGPLNTDEADWQKALRTGQFRQYIKDHPDGIHIDEALDKITNAGNRQDNMVLIPSGTFQMGSTDGENDEKPLHTVAVSSFYLSKYEVTVAEFRTFIEASGYRTDAEKEGSSRGYEGTEWKDVKDRNWRHDPEGKPAPDNHPVINVSWNDTQEYARWLSQKTGYSYRLPTEAEWEYTAGNGARHTKYSWGDGGPNGKNGGNVADESKNPSSGSVWSTKFDGFNDGYWYTAPVGSYNPNDFGLFDMTGNVWEWCSDWYGSDYYAKSPSKDPTGPSSGSYRVIRGGSWCSFPQNCRVAFRGNDAPGSRNDYVGFRLARTK